MYTVIINLYFMISDTKILKLMMHFCLYSTALLLLLTALISGKFLQYLLAICKTSNRLSPK